MSATVVSVEQLPQSANSGAQAADARETFVWMVILSEPDGVEGARTARDAVGIPDVGDPLGTTGLTVLRKRAEPDGNQDGIHYKVTVEYGIDAVNSAGGGGTPWTRKDRIRRSVKAYQVSQSVDMDGKPIENKAHDPLSGGLVFDRYNPIRVVNRYRKFVDFDPEAAEACIGSINDAAVTLNPQRGILTIPAYTARLLDITCDDALWPGSNTFYFNITFSLEILGDVPLEYYYATNKGPHYLDASDSNIKKPYYKTVTDSTTGKVIPVASEVLLKDNGDKADDGSYQGYTHVYGQLPVSGDEIYDLKFKRAVRKSWTWI